MEKVTVTFVGPISHEWAISQPFVLTWIVLAALDLALGTMAAWVRREISSAVSWRGMMRKCGTMILLAMAVIVDPLIPNVNVAIIGATAFCLTECYSILENAGKLGIKIPRPFRQALAKLGKDEDKG